MVPRIPEKRCPICGALYNVEPCNPSTHNALSARIDERAKIVERLRKEVLRQEARIQGDIRGQVVREIADLLEKEGREIYPRKPVD